MPTRFALIRDTAQWVPEFDPAWWRPIDAAYAEYDREVERIVRERWAPFAQELNLAGQSRGPFPPDDARARRARQRAIDAEIAAAERAMLGRIDAELPAGADRFIELLTVRIECARAAAVWTERERPLPGPLEQLCRVGVHRGEDATLDAAIPAYREIARVARRLANERAEEYLAWGEDYVALDEALNQARAASSDANGARAVERVQRRMDRRQEAMRSARAETTESLRMKLLAVGDDFARAIADEAVRGQFIERLEADLHEGMSTQRTMEMYARLAERVIAQAHPEDPSKVEAFRSDVARGLELQRSKRSLLRSSDPSVRKATYEELSKMPGAIIDSAGKKLDERLGGRLFWQAVRVDLGYVDEDDAVKAVFANDLPDPDDRNPSDVAESVAGAAGGAERIAFYGSALSPRVLRALGAGLGFDEDQQKQFDGLVEEAIERLVEMQRFEVSRVDEAIRSLDSGGPYMDGDAMRDAVGKTMSEVRGATASMLAANRAANARMLEVAAGIAGVDSIHPVMQEARIELELLVNIGSRGLSQREGRRELEEMAGVTVECYSNPFAIARLMEASEGERNAAVALISARGEELIAAAQATRRQMLDNLEKFLRLVVARDDFSAFGLPPWHLGVASPEAVDLRFEIVEEIREVLGSEVARAYERCWRSLERPALEQPRSAAVARLEAVAGDAGAETVGGVAVRTLLAVSEASRDQALREAHRWRASTVVGGRLETPEQWRRVTFDEPLGAFLYSRVADVDDRAVAASEVLAGVIGQSDLISGAARIRERPIVVTLRPWWPPMR